MLRNNLYSEEVLVKKEREVKHIAQSVERRTLQNTISTGPDKSNKIGPLKIWFIWSGSGLGLCYHISDLTGIRSSENYEKGRDMWGV